MDYDLQPPPSHPPPTTPPPLSSNKRAAGSVAAAVGKKRKKAEEPSAPISSYFQLLPLDLASELINYSKYNGLHTAIQTADAMAEADPKRYSPLIEALLYTLVEEYVERRHGNARASVKREWEEMLEAEEKIAFSGKYLTAADRRELLRQLRHFALSSVCRFCGTRANTNYRFANSHLRRFYSNAMELPTHRACSLERIARMRDPDTGEPLYEQVPRDKVPPASFMRYDATVNQHDAHVYVETGALREARLKWQRAHEFLAKHMRPALESAVAAVVGKLASDPKSFVQLRCLAKTRDVIFDDVSSDVPARAVERGLLAIDNLESVSRAVPGMTVAKLKEYAESAAKIDVLKALLAGCDQRLASPDMVDRLDRMEALVLNMTPVGGVSPDEWARDKVAHIESRCQSYARHNSGDIRFTKIDSLLYSLS